MTPSDAASHPPKKRARLSPQPGTVAWHVSKDPLALLSLFVLLVFVAVAVVAPWVAPFPDQGLGVTHIEQKLQPPGWPFMLGTDSLGRDILSRIIFGARTALVAGVAIVAIGAVAGTLLGAAAGYFGGWIDEAIMRVTDVFLAFPSLLLAMTVAVVLQPSLGNTIIAISLTWWPWYARIARGQAVSIRERKYVKAARGIGVSHAKIIWRHILPNILTPISVQAMMDLGAAILTVSALSFVGLGVPQPTADWGAMISEGRMYVQTGQWWVPTYPGLALFITIMAANLLGDAVQAAANPRTRKTAA